MSKTSWNRLKREWEKEGKREERREDLWWTFPTDLPLSVGFQQDCSKPVGSASDSGCVQRLELDWQHAHSRLHARACSKELHSACVMRKRCGTESDLSLC